MTIQTILAFNRKKNPTFYLLVLNEIFIEFHIEKREYDLSTTSSETIWKGCWEPLFLKAYLYNSKFPWALFKKRSDSSYRRGTLPSLRKVKFTSLQPARYLSSFLLHFKPAQSQRKKKKKERKHILFIPSCCFQFQCN